VPCGQLDFHCPYSPPGFPQSDRILKPVLIYNSWSMLFSILLSANTVLARRFFLFHIHGFV